jgi:hypothetical protein
MVRDRAGAAFGQAVEQDAPLRVNDAGVAVLPVWSAWKLMLTEALGAMSPSYETFFAVIAPVAGEQGGVANAARRGRDRGETSALRPGDDQRRTVVPAGTANRTPVQMSHPT